ncbi:MAG: MG2 domain-containing protein, partial [Planctomycetaceae bacterium]
MYLRVFLLLCLASCIPLAVTANPSEQQQRAIAARAQQDGEFKDAYEIYRRLLLESLPDQQAHKDLPNAIQCLNRLGRIGEFDKLLEDTISRHSTDWQLLREASQQYLNANHGGVIVAGEFKRGPHRGPAKYVNASDRDRVRAIQLLLEAINVAKPKQGNGQSITNTALSRIYRDLANTIRRSRSGAQLVALTDLESLPDYTSGSRFYRGGFGRTVQGAPVNEDGTPLIHSIPATWKEGTSDGERWRWAMLQMVELNPQFAPERDYEYAMFLKSQFGVQTLGGMFSQTDSKSKDGPWNVNTLTENETIAKLATGVKRLELPEQANFVSLLKQVAKGNSPFASRATDQLVSIFSNRRQYPQAAAVLRTALQRFGEQVGRRSQLNQIVGNWGRFENGQVHPAGKGATVDFRFRNANEVSLTAKRIRIRDLLRDVKAYLQSKPNQLDYQKINLNNIGYRLVRDNENQYAGETVATWKLAIDPPGNHFDDVTTISTPLQKAGAYLITAQLPGGNTSRIVVWLTDAAIVRKQLKTGTMFFVADATTGKPLPNAKVNFFGFKQTRVERQKYKIDIRQADLQTNVDGLTTGNKKNIPADYQWLVSTDTPNGGFAMLGFDRVWYGRSNSFVYNQNKVYLVTDRPVYRPGQTVKYKFWVRNPRFDGPGKSFANSAFELQLRDGRGKDLVKQKITTDELGNFAGEFKLKDDTSLGRYSLSLRTERIVGGGSFRVEEYKKPEYEVTVKAPERSVALGEKAKVTVQAKYYFGSPVTNATVHYKVSRTSINKRWYPRGRWD